MVRNMQNIAHALLRLGLVLGVMLLGFAHAPLRAAGPDMAAFAMPDGTMPQLCQTAPDEGTPSQHVTCPACHLAANLGTPAAKPRAIWALVPHVQPFGTAAQVLIDTIAAAPPQARAPPTLTL
jgi:hypothetical protein